MISKRVNFKFILNIVIVCSISVGSETYNSASIEQAHSNNELKHSELISKRELNSLVQMARAEYSFFLMLFALGQRTRGSIKSNYSVLFANEVNEVANNLIKPARFNIRDFDNIANGEGPRITWTKIHPDAIDYIRILETVIPGIDLMIKNQLIKQSEVERLREFAQGALEFRSRLVHSDDKISIVEKWKEIVEKLDIVLTEPERYRTWSDNDTINLGIFLNCNFWIIMLIFDGLKWGKCPT